MPVITSVRKLTKANKTAKGKAAKRREPLLATVVDCHHHVMKPMWDAVASRKLPSKGVTLLHFDSHPDMGTIGAEEDLGSSRNQRVKRLVPKIFQNAFNQEECLRLSDIATWIPTLVAQGLVDEVIWIAGWWCKQFPTGRFDLFVGRSKKDGMMKIAFPDDKKRSVAYYWDSEGCVEKLKNLVDLRPWTLTVVKFQRNCTFKKEDVRSIQKLCSNKPWILDIDEDVYSCQNPFVTEFEMMFGKDRMKRLEKIWDTQGSDDAELERRLERIVRQDTFLMPKAKYLAHEDVVEARKTLYKSKASAEKMFLEFRDLCRTILPKKEKGEANARDVYDGDLITNPASMSTLPHHITSLPDITAMIQESVRLFQKIKKSPGVVTVATSRSDYYTPEQQAGTINELLLDALASTWKKTRATRIIRRDFRSPLSIADRYDPITPSLLALMLSRGKENHLKPRKLGPDEETDSDDDDE